MVEFGEEEPKTPLEEASDFYAESRHLTRDVLAFGANRRARGWIGTVATHEQDVQSKQIEGNVIEGEM